MVMNYKPDPMDLSKVKLRTCVHRKFIWIFEHNFPENKAIFCRHTGVWQGKLTKLSGKFAEKTGEVSMHTGSK